MLLGMKSCISIQIGSSLNLTSSSFLLFQRYNWHHLGVVAVCSSMNSPVLRKVWGTTNSLPIFFREFLTTMSYLMQKKWWLFPRYKHFSMVDYNQFYNLNPNCPLWAWVTTAQLFPWQPIVFSPWWIPLTSYWHQGAGKKLEVEVTHSIVPFFNFLWIWFTFFG